MDTCILVELIVVIQSFSVACQDQTDEQKAIWPFSDKLAAISARRISVLLGKRDGTRCSCSDCLDTQG